MGLSEKIMNSSHKDLIVQDCCTMIDVQLASKSGMSGIALKAAFAALKGIQPAYISNVIESLLPVCLTAIDPIWSEGVQQGEPVEYLTANSNRTANALLSVTDARVKNTKRQLVRGTYEKFRNSAEKHVQEAVPDLAQVIGKYANN
ncbi:DUF6918 family protein [Dolichospermum compactum]|uniref:Uncharacterized protein n=1 Tax=Dolichospermum compactum NIES-806 TaxID=1973481 RepID=A0A1Z4V835_9CYAN|nr:hypothetical protein [Dolichospermum compactum]BAZ87588.1 hypothetical protein NIES806_38180 [Dolichospermum compactum NIES-806]